VLWHEDIGGYAEALLSAGLFEGLFDCVLGFVGVEKGLTLVTAEGDEVELLGLLEASEAGGHGGMSSLHPTLRKRREGWGTRAFWFVKSVRAAHPHPSFFGWRRV
jgi:hypothetical protein